MPYNRRYNVLSASLNKTFLSLSVTSVLSGAMWCKCFVLCDTSVFVYFVQVNTSVSHTLLAVLIKGGAHHLDLRYCFYFTDLLSLVIRM